MAWANQSKIQNVARLYFVPFMGHVHKNPLATSSSLTAIQCGHVVKVIDDKNIVIPMNWHYVEVGDEKGFIENIHLSKTMPDCFQGKYPKFMNALNLDLTDMYFFGRLVDQYVEGKSQVQ